MNVDLAHALDAYHLDNYLPIHEPETQKLLPKIQITPEDRLISKEENDLSLKDKYKRLSKDAKEVIEIILNPPQHFQDRLNIKNSKKITQGKLTEFLRLIDSARWKHNVIQKAFNEIKQLLREEK
ncbi:hypothetical protein LCGC14_2488740 [marine sediment metagenome]|uniref:Uncharacterized protein n=1 Tax=marine sediment metagenome TaxID=412755 RepID=A0A0F9B641_9ZZZZ